MAKKYFFDQYSQEWWDCRKGIPTASNFHKIITATGKASKQADDYMNRLIATRLGIWSDKEEDWGRSKWMEHGVTNEDAAFARLGRTRKLTLKKVGFVTTDDGRLGASPDALVEKDNAAVEIKAPAPWTHVGYLRIGHDLDYRTQVNGHMLVGEFDACIFYSYHPQCPDYFMTILPDKPFQKVMRDLLYAFCDKLDEETERVRRMGVFIPTTSLTDPGYPEAYPPGPFSGREQ
jgi:hypothetical protein